MKEMIMEGSIVSCGGCFSWLKGGKEYLLMIMLQFGSAGMYIMSMHAFNKGMSHYVLIVYRNAIAAITLAPFAIFLERKVRPKMTFRIFSEIMALAFLEVILDQCFTMLGMKLTSASFTSAVMNTVPSITFVLAVILRLERMKMKERACQAKVVGTIITLGAVFLMAMYKGPIVISSMKHGSSNNAQSSQPENVNDPTGSHWLMGAAFVLIGCSAFAAFYILQSITLRKYPAEMSLSTWICFIGALQSFAVASYMERRRPHAWSLAFDYTFFAPAYSGIVASGIQYYVQGIVMRTMGPVFVTAFNPLRMIIVSVLAFFVLSEKLHLGSVIGGLVVAVGLYLVAWGKYKEHKNGVVPSSPDLSKEGHHHVPVLPITVPPSDDKPHLVIMDNNDHHQSNKNTMDVESNNPLTHS